MTALRNLSATVWLIAANVLVFIVLLAGVISPSAVGVPSDVRLLLTHPWTPLTYMFVHFSFWHLLINMLWLWMFGRLLTDIFSNRALTLLYLTGGLSGALFYIAATLFLPVSSALCGASAAVVAVMTAAGLRLPDMPVRLFFFAPVKLKWIVLAGILLLFLGAGGAGFFAHLGGVCGGLSFVLIPARKRSVKPRKAPKPSRRRLKEINRKMTARRNEMKRLDDLLDRVRISGFDSLSRAEKAELKRISECLNKGSEK